MRFEFIKVFEGDGSNFSATREAERWLAENGYSVGTYCRGAQRAVMIGSNWVISKWHNIPREEIAENDGEMNSARTGPVTLSLRKAPKK